MIASDTVYCDHEYIDAGYTLQINSGSHVMKITKLDIGRNYMASVGPVHVISTNFHTPYSLLVSHAFCSNAVSLISLQALTPFILLRAMNFCMLNTRLHYKI